MTFLTKGSSILFMHSKNTEDVYEKHEHCLKCGTSLDGRKGWKYCSERCRKLYLKAQYRKRNTIKIREYNRAYRHKAPDAYFVRSKKQRELILRRMPVCQRCGYDQQLQVCHIKPHWAGGTNKTWNFVVLCQSCHHVFDNLLRDFWKQ